jgi:hypothetical protein
VVAIIDIIPSLSVIFIGRVCPHIKVNLQNPNL